MKPIFFRTDGYLLFYSGQVEESNKIFFRKFKIKRHLKTPAQIAEQFEKMGSLFRTMEINLLNLPFFETFQKTGIGNNTAEFDQIIMVFIESKNPAIKHFSDQYSWVKLEDVITNEDIPWWDRYVISENMYILKEAMGGVS